MAMDWVERAEENRRKSRMDGMRSRDVAHILDVSPDDVIEVARQGKLKARKKGRFWRFRKSDVMAFQKRYRKGASGEGWVQVAKRR
jgi:excisionase family DNA binding protein